MAVITMHVNEAEEKAIREAAAASHLKLSTYIKQVLMKHISEASPIDAKQEQYSERYKEKRSRH